MGQSSSSWSAAEVPSAIAGQIVVITGGNAGLGLELCNYLGAAGAVVIMAGRSSQRLQAAAASLPAGMTVHTKVVDLASLASIRAFATGIISEFGRVDIVRAFPLIRHEAPHSPQSHRLPCAAH